MNFNEEELAAIAAHLAPALGPLALLPEVELTPDGREAAVAAYDALAADAQAAWRELVAALAAPARVAALHYTVADERISRQFLAWPDGSDAIVYLARQDRRWQAGTRSPLQLATLLAEVLAAGDGLRPAPLHMALGAPAVLTLLAVLDQWRYARLHSQLTHQAPVTSFAPAEVLERLAGAGVEDFRWPLPFLEKVLPARLPAAFTAADVDAGLSELADAGLVELLSDDGPAPLIALAPAGAFVADVVLHDVSKLALRLSECRPDGVVGHDVLLLVRGAAHLLLFELAGEAGALAALDAGQSQALWEELLTAPDEAAVAASRPGAGPAPAPPAVTCAGCGRAVPAGLNYCEQCGFAVGGTAVGSTPVLAAAAACPDCGRPVARDARFCQHCGRSLIPA